MISLPFLRRGDPTVDPLYGMIVAQARSAAFYRDFGVPDTVAGRIEMIMLHLVLVLRRLRAGAGAGRSPGQGLFDRFCQDMDDNFREMGVGDLKVPKEMRRIGEAFYGRARVYDAALDAGDGAALAAALARNVFGADAPVGADRLAAYMAVAARELAVRPDAALVATGPMFPDPAPIRMNALQGAPRR